MRVWQGAWAAGPVHDSTGRAASCRLTTTAQGWCPQDCKKRCENVHRRVAEDRVFSLKLFLQGQLGRADSQAKLDTFTAIAGSWVAAVFLICALVAHGVTHRDSRRQQEGPISQRRLCDSLTGCETVSLQGHPVLYPHHAAAAHCPLRQKRSNHAYWPAGHAPLTHLTFCCSHDHGRCGSFSVMVWRADNVQHLPQPSLVPQTVQLGNLKTQLSGSRHCLSGASCARRASSLSGHWRLRCL